MSERAIIIGAGPAGLTAGLEFLRRTGVQPIILEASEEIGGISRTIRYNGNRMDIGGHRFFSKSDRVMQWWMDLMPPEAGATATAEPIAIAYQGKQRTVAVPARLPEEPPLRGLGPLDRTASPEAGTDPVAVVIAAPPSVDPDLVMLVRPRKSRIYYLRKFFDYPIKLSGTTISNLGPVRMAKIGVSYVASRVAPIKPEKSLEDFLINRFGRELYLTFFKSYTEKVWGTPCDQISAEWGAQRIKGLSLTTALKHFVRKAFSRTPKPSATQGDDISQKSTDTSLIERFLYPKFGPGQLWEHVAGKITAAGGEIHMGWKVVAIKTEPTPDGPRVTAVIANNQAGERRTLPGDFFLSTMPMCDLTAALAAGGEIHMGWKVVAIETEPTPDGPRVTAVIANNQAGERRTFPGDFFLSTMPMRDLTQALAAGGATIPANVREVSDGLQYRDFITIGILANKLNVTETDHSRIRDTWIYIQEPDVLLGRLQIFNNWSPYMVADPSKVWIGLEYFCQDTDPLWHMADPDLKAFAAAELQKIGILSTADVLDAHVVRVPKTYPAYFGTYARFDELRSFTDSFSNLFLVGRNGMHKYNNQDHSMLTAMSVVDGIAAGHVDKAALWSINTEQEYHEEKKS